MAKPKAIQNDPFFEVEDDGDGIWNILLVERKTTEYVFALNKAAADKVCEALNQSHGY